MIPKILLQKADELERNTAEKYPELAPLAKQCFLNTIETTVTQLEDGSYFVITGDIPAMWLRDSAAQLRPYVKYAKEDPDLQEILRSVLKKYTFYVNLDPYSNAFNSEPKAGYSEHDHTNFQSKWIWERKYEVDSLCAPLYLAHQYFEATGDRSIFTEEFRMMVQTIVQTFLTEQRHDRSSYWFVREHCPKSDTLPFAKGRPVNTTGMTWSGFRPSDDACKFGYLIPSNMMAAVAMDKAVELLLAGDYGDPALVDRCKILGEEIRDGIETYGIYDHPKYGKIYAYETDGFGNYNLMDDANSPSLLSIPYLGYKPAEDPIYQNTRRFVLSTDNPYYYEGLAAKGVGSPHTPGRYIWHIGLVMQILTSTDPAEKRACLRMLARTHAGTNYMHEGFDADDPTQFTRPWFAWANTLFAQMLEEEVSS
ncbi:MAG: glycoside hydrolase family 125 protein [Acutalibacter sp.]|jgi:meiotically up-regulated gene 157 (Mug157) protein